MPGSAHVNEHPILSEWAENGPPRRSAAAGFVLLRLLEPSGRDPHGLNEPGGIGPGERKGLRVQGRSQKRYQRGRDHHRQRTIHEPLLNWNGATGARRLTGFFHFRPDSLSRGSSCSGTDLLNNGDAKTPNGEFSPFPLFRGANFRIRIWLKVYVDKFILDRIKEANALAPVLPLWSPEPITLCALLYGT